MKYSEAHDLTKAKAYTLDPEGVSFVNIRKANKITNPVRLHLANIDSCPSHDKDVLSEGSG